MQNNIMVSISNNSARLFYGKIMSLHIVISFIQHPEHKQNLLHLSQIQWS